MTTIRLRRGTASEWTAANPILALGEPGYERDTGKQKVGDGTTTWTALAYVAGSAAGGGKVNPVYGDGSDGTVTLSVNTELTGETFYQNLTLAAGVQVNAHFAPVHVLGTLTINAGASLNADGNPGYGTSGMGAERAHGHLGRGGISSLPGGGPYNVAQTIQAGGNGGKGGTGNGTTVAVTPLFQALGSFPLPRTLPTASTGMAIVANDSGAPSVWSYSGGTAGSTGGNGPQYAGGGGGAGGDVLIVCARTVVNNGTIRAGGGNGGNSDQGSVAPDTRGGGGGGGGGLAVLICDTLTGSGPTAPGGTGGLGTPGSGGPGAAGLTGTAVLLNGSAA